MESDNLPSTSNRAKHLKYVSEKFNASNQYPVAFEEFRKFTNVDDYVVREMERSGPDICRINYSIRHKYYPIVYKQFYESRTIREKMMRRGLSVKPIPRFLKERLMRMPGEDFPFLHKTKDKQGKVDAKIKSVQTKHSKLFTAISPAYKILTEKNKKTNKKSAEKDTSLRHTPKTTGKSKSKTALTKHDNAVTEDTQKITNFFSALKLVKTSEDVSHSDKEEGETRKRKPETRDISPVVKRLKDVGTSNVPPNNKKPKNTGPSESKSMPSSPFSRRKTEDDRMQERRKNMNKFKNDENRIRRTRIKSRIESSISDDSDIHSYVEMINLTDTKNNSRRRICSTISSPSTLQKSPLPKRNRTEDFQKPNASSKKNTRKKDTNKSDNDQRQSSSDAEMALLSLSTAAKKSNFQVSCEIQDWLNKAIKTLEDESDDESVLSFFEEEFTAIDKLKAIEKYPNDVRNYIKYLLNAEIQKRNLANKKPVKNRGASRSKVVAAFADMTFDDYKILINADKIYSQGLAEKKTVDEITSGVRSQYEAIIEGKRAWPKDQHVKLSTLRNYLRSKGVPGHIELKHIPPRLLSFEECLEHTNLKECTSFSRPKPPGSYKQLMNLCKRTYLKCCTEGVWIDGLHFTDSNNQQEGSMQYTQFKTASFVLPSIQEITDQSTNTSVESLTKDQVLSDERQAPPHENGQTAGNSLTAGNQENFLKNANAPVDDVEKNLEIMFADPSLEAAKGSVVSENVNQIVSDKHVDHTTGSAELSVSQPLLGVIPPSPCLFQSSGESDQKACEFQQAKTCPPEAIFIPCHGSMMLNTGENNITGMGVDGCSQDPFASQELEVDDNQVKETILDSSVLGSVVKKEPCTASGEGYHYSLDDSVEIVEMPPSEPIVIEDEETAPDLLNTLLTGPAQNNTNLTGSVQNNATSNSPLTQSLSCTETFVHAQQLPSNLSSVQSQLNPPQSHEESSREDSHTEKDSITVQKGTDKEDEIDLIKMVLQVDKQKSAAIYEESLSRRISLQSPGNMNESKPLEDVDSSKAINVDDGMSTLGDASLIGSKCEGSLVGLGYDSIRSQKNPSEVELTQNTTGTIYIRESTINEKQQHFIQATDGVSADNQESLAVSEETEPVNKESKDNEQSIKEFIESNDISDSPVSVYVISTQSENLMDTEIQASAREDEAERMDIDSKDFISSEGNRDTVVQTDIQRSDIDTDSSEKDTNEDQQSSNQEDPGLFEETESVKVKSEGNLSDQCIEECIDSNRISNTPVSVYVISTQSEKAMDTEVPTSEQLNEGERINKNFIPPMSSEGNNRDTVVQTDNHRSDIDTDSSEKDASEEQQSSNEERQEDKLPDFSLDTIQVHIQKRLPSDMQQPLGDNPVAEKIDITRKDLNDNHNPAEDTLHLVEFQNTNEAFVGETSNVTSHQDQPFDGCNLKRNKNVSETDISSKDSDIQLMQVSEEDNSSADIQMETDVLKVVEKTPTSDNGGSLKKFQSEYAASFQHGIFRKGDDIDETEAQSSSSTGSRQNEELEEQSSASAVCVGEEDAVAAAATGDSYKVVKILVQKEDEETSYALTDDSDETNQDIKVIFNAVESDSDLLGFKRDVSQPITTDAIQQTSSHSTMSSEKITRSENQADRASNFVQPNNISVNPPNQDIVQSVDLIKSSKKPLTLVFTHETLNLNKKRSFVLPAFLPIKRLQSDKSDDFIEPFEMEDESEIGNEKANLVEVPILINRRLIKLLPFNILTSQQLQPTTNAYKIDAINAMLEFRPPDLRMPDTNENEKENAGIANSLQLEVSSINQMKTNDNTEDMPKPKCTKQKRNKRLRLGRLKADSCTSVENQLNNKSKSPLKNDCPTVRSDTKLVQPSHSNLNKRKKLSPKKVVKKPSPLDFVPQKTHAFRSLPLGAAKKNLTSATGTKVQINEQTQSKTEESNYNIEDVSQAVVSATATATASQILSTDCTYFESSQLVRNMHNYCKPIETQDPSEEHRKSLSKPKVNTFDRISLSEGLMARKVWQVNLNWKARGRMSIEVRFSVNRHSLTVCNNSAQLLFNFSPAIWFDILRVLREIDHFEYKRLAMKNYQAATPLHKALRYLFDSTQQVVNVKLMIDSLSPYASCEQAKPLHRKPFQCLTKAIAPNILSRMKAMKDSLRDNMMDE